MTEQEIRTILSRQREYFATGATLSREFRAKQLGKLKTSLQCHETELNDALQQDLGKSRMESYMCEIGLTLSELTWMQKHLRGLMRDKRVLLNHEISNVYLLERGPEAVEFRLQPEEVQSVMWIDFDECYNNVKNNLFEHCICMDEMDMLYDALSHRKSH